MTTDNLRPQSWDEYIGQEPMKARLQTRIDAANRDGRMIPHVMLAAPAGVGKTSLAYLIAGRLGVEIESYLAKTETTGNDLYEWIFYANEDSVVFIDEIHRLRPKVQEELLGPLDEEAYFETSLGREFIYTRFTLIGATTNYDKVIPPLRDRFHITPPFEEYSHEEMARIVISMGKKVGIEFEADAAKQLGVASGGRPRAAKKLVLAARDLPDPNDVQEVLDLVGVTPEGLTYHHLKYLQTLRKATRHRAGAKVLAASIGMPPDALEDMEQLLVDLDFVERTSSGRVLRPLGNKYLINLSKKEAAHG